jgi:transposase
MKSACPILCSCSFNWIHWSCLASAGTGEGRSPLERKHYTGEEKVAILRRHLLDKVPVSDLCEEHGLQPTVFYRWQKEFFENGAAAFEGKGRPDHQAEQQRIEFLEKKIQTKDEVPAELNGRAHCLKKSLGEL